MKQKKSILSLFCVAALLSACERDVEFNGNAPAPKIIVNSIAGSDNDTHSLEISESVFLFGDRKPQIVDITALGIRLNGEELTLTSGSKGNSLYYSFPAKLSSGDKLEVWGESPAHGKISGTDVVPHPARIKDLQAEWFTGDKDGQSYLRTLVTIADRPGVREWYRIVIKTMSIAEGEKNPESSVWNRQRVYVDREILFNNIGGSVLAGNDKIADTYRIFSDESIDGQEYTLNVYVELDRETMDDGWGHTVDIAEQWVKVEVHSVSENMFKYLRSLELAMAENNFSEPARIYSNIVNGYGILGTYNVAEMTLKVPRE